MIPDYDYPREFIERLVEMANASTFVDADDLKANIEAHDLFFGVFQDPTKPGGVGIYIIKGDTKIRHAPLAESGERVTVGAVSCRELEEAVAIRETLWRSEVH